MGPVDQRFGEWASASRTFSAITDHIAFVQREVHRLFVVFIFSPRMHAPAPPAVRLRLLLTTATFSPSRHHHRTWRWHAWSPYATAASRHQSRAACVTVQTPFTASSLSFEHNQPHSLQFTHGKPLLFCWASPEHEHCCGK